MTWVSPNQSITEDREKNKKNKKIFKIPLTNELFSVILYRRCEKHLAADDGSIAQLGEHLPYKQRVTGSSPVVPTNFIVAR